jgi:glucuronyl/N-acetylglucosaminyl transferase EXT2/alpha-1,4-N-acetylglucosaminyltransferase EXTL3
MNEKFWPNPKYRTKAVLLHDDDVYYHPRDMEFVFQTWRKQGQDRIVGAFARMHVKAHDDSQWILDMAHDAYSVVMTGLVFIHVAFLEYWWSDDPLMAKIREYVDALVNCDDIAMNFLVSAITCQPPLQVNGLLPPSNEEPKIAISQSEGHNEKRLQCMRDLPEYFGSMPLKNTTLAITHGQFPW